MRALNARSLSATRTKKLRLRPRFHPLPSPLGKQRRRRNPMTLAHAAGVDAGAAAAAEDRALRLKLRAKLSRLLRLPRNRQQNLNSPRRLMLPRFPQPSRVRASLRRLRLLCFPANRFRSMAACPARKPRSQRRRRPLQPARARHSSLPHLFETPIEWDGSGLLPGESLSRHRSRQPEPEIESTDEPQADSPVESGFSAELATEVAQEETIEEALRELPPSRRKLRGSAPGERSNSRKSLAPDSAEPVSEEESSGRKLP